MLIFAVFVQIKESKWLKNYWKVTRSDVLVTCSDQLVTPETPINTGVLREKWRGEEINAKRLSGKYYLGHNHIGRHSSHRKTSVQYVELCYHSLFSALSALSARPNYL